MNRFDKAQQKRIIERTQSGQVVINDCLMQKAISDLPFGGIRESGTGCAHGKWGFDECSHKRAIVDNPLLGDLPFLVPPYDKWTKVLQPLEKVLLKRRPLWAQMTKGFRFAFCGLVIYYAAQVLSVFVGATDH